MLFEKNKKKGRFSGRPDRNHVERSSEMLRLSLVPQIQVRLRLQPHFDQEETSRALVQHQIVHISLKFAFRSPRDRKQRGKANIWPDNRSGQEIHSQRPTPVQHQLGDKFHFAGGRLGQVQQLV